MRVTDQNPEALKNSCPVHVVLVEPEIPQNTGNIARSCMAVGACLHLVKPYGFFINDRQLKRAGMDYWHEVRLVEHSSLDAFLKCHGHEPLALFSKRGSRLYTEIPLKGTIFLIFGGESLGLPTRLCQEFPNQIYRLPMRPDVRSLNLASAASAVLFEALRVRSFPGLLPV